MAAAIGTAWIQIKPSMKGVGKDIGAQLDGELGSATSKAESRFAGLGNKLALALKAGAVAAGALIVSQIGGAIRRVDTLANASRTFENMGFGADVVKTSMDALEKSIKGLPTPLDGAVRGMTALAATYGDVKAGQKIFTALNNAILGFGGTADMVNNAVLQLSQLPMDGPLDAQTWMSLRNSGLTPVLVAMAKDMGLGVNEMKKKFGEGELTVRDFTIALTRMDKEGGGGMKSLQQIAQDSTAGIGTSFENLKTGIQRGLASILESIGSQNIKQGIEKIGKAFEEGLKKVGDAIAALVANQKLRDFLNWIINNKDAVVGALVGITTAVVAFKTAMAISAVIDKTKKAVQGFSMMMDVYKASVQSGATVMQALNVVMAMNPFVLLAVALVALIAGLVFFFTKTETGKKIFQQLKEKVIEVWDKIKEAFGKAVEFISGVWDSISSIVMTAVEYIKTIIMTIVETVMTIATAIWNIIFPIVELWWTIWRMIFAIVQIAISVILAIIFTLVGFIWNNVLWPIINLYITAWQMIFNAVSAVIGWIFNILSAVAGWIWDNVLAPIINFFSSAWNMIFGFVSGFVSGTKDVLLGVANWIKTNIIDKVAGFFSGLWEGAKTKASEIFESIKTIIKDAINWMIDKINWIIRKVNDTAGKVPGVPNIGEIPKLAKGGIVSSPTLALIGEGREAEAVIPLSKLDQMINVNDNKGNGTSRTVQIYGDIHIASDVDADKFLTELGLGRQDKLATRSMSI